MTITPTLPAAPIPVLENAPGAYPVRYSGTLADSWTDIITVPDWDIPSQPNEPLGTSPATPGIAEPSTPLWLCNTHSAAVTVDVWIITQGGGTGTYVAKGLTIPPDETLPIPLNGMIFYTDDKLQAQASVDAVIDANMAWNITTPEPIVSRS